MKEQVSCFECGNKVKGSLQFIPFLKENLGWVKIDKDNLLCPKHQKQTKFKMYFEKR